MNLNARNWPVTEIRGPVHLMGVGGAGMCALAEVMVRAGLVVSGCDLAEGEAIHHLQALGVEFAHGHDVAHVGDVGTVIVSAAVPEDHAELVAARKAGAQVMKRAEALGRWVAQGRVVAVAGTHGKTTTTALVAAVLEAADLDPTAFVGGRVASWGGNLRPGRSDFFVVEADEYDRSFHALSPDVAIVTNVEADHLDIYGSAKGVQEGFVEFLAGLRSNGRVVACADDPGAASLVPYVGPAALTYGLSAGSQLRAEAVRIEPAGTVCRVVEEGRVLGELGVTAPGLHNLRNALAAVAAARILGVSFDAIRRGLAGFTGVGRRFETLGSVEGVMVVDDYAHHPTEIKATLAGARSAFPDRRLIAVFQPHLFSRTRDFHAEFGEALAAADVVWVTDVYPAREDPIPGITGRVVAEAARASRAGPVHYAPDLGSLPGAMASMLQPGDLVLTLGAGSIEGTGPALLEELVRLKAMGREEAHA